MIPVTDKVAGLQPWETRLYYLTEGRLDDPISVSCGFPHQGMRVKPRSASQHCLERDRVAKNTLEPSKATHRVPETSPIILGHESEKRA